MATTTTTTWLGRLFATVVSWFSKASAAIHDVTVLADNVTNAIKNSPITGGIETALEMSIPASTGLVEAFKLELPNIVTKLNWAVAEESKTPDQLVSDGLAYLESIKGTDDYVIQLNSLAAKIQKWFSDNQGLGLTIQQALLTPQIVHNPTLLSIATDVENALETTSKAVNSVVTATAQPAQGQVVPNGGTAS